MLKTTCSLLGCEETHHWDGWQHLTSPEVFFAGFCRPGHGGFYQLQCIHRGDVLFRNLRWNFISATFLLNDERLVVVCLGCFLHARTAPCFMSPEYQGTCLTAAKINVPPKHSRQKSWASSIWAPRAPRGLAVPACPWASPTCPQPMSAPPAISPRPSDTTAGPVPSSP